LVATTKRRLNNIYILDMKKREKIEATQKDSKEEKVPKTKNKDEVLLTATCLGGVLLEDWLLSLMSTLVMGFGLQD
jgi:hypothetical protein